MFSGSLFISDLMPIATVLMHGSVRGRAMDLMLWKRKKEKEKEKRLEKRELQREQRGKENPKKKIRIVK